MLEKKYIIMILQFPWKFTFFYIRTILIDERQAMNVNFFCSKKKVLKSEPRMTLFKKCESLIMPDTQIFSRGVILSDGGAALQNHR